MGKKKINDVQIKKTGLVWLTVYPGGGACMSAYTSQELAKNSYEVTKLGYEIESRFLCDFSI